MTPHPTPVHGGTLEAARLRFPAAPLPFIDLSTGINPTPYPLPPLSADAFMRLPEPGALLALQAAACAAYRAPDPAMVVAAPGTQLLISLLPRLLPQRSVTVFGPTYAEHARAWALAGSRLGEGGDAAVLCNPNNPDGRRLPPGAVLDLAGRHRLLVVDEAFADFEAETSVVPHMGSRPDLVVLRSFGKAYGLAGLRLGFAIAAPATAAMIRDALGPWAVGGPALAAGCQALADPAWLLAAGTRLKAGAGRLDSMLGAAGGRVIGGTALFRLAEFESAPTLVDHLGHRGIIVRAFPDQPLWLRFGIPGPADWNRVAAALSSWTRSRTAAALPARR